MTTANNSLAAVTTSEKSKFQRQTHYTKSLYQPQHVSYFARKVLDGLKRKNATEKHTNKEPPLAPYGSRLAQSLNSGKIPENDVYIFCGDLAWKKAAFFNQNRFCLCLPPGANPFHFSWPVSQCSVLLFETSQSEISYIEKIVLCLLNSGATIVRVISFENKIYIYRRKWEAA